MENFQVANCYVIIYKKSKPFLIHVFIPLVIGGLIYVFFRSKTLRFFDWIDKIGLSDIVNVIRTMVHPYKEILPNWFLNSLPDGLWVYSFSAMLFFSSKKYFIQNKMLLMLPFVLILIMEVLQLLDVICGTFDIMDLVMSLIMNLLLIAILELKYNEKIN